MFHIFKVSRFFKVKEKEKILTVIREAEKRTSGEIRVHVESKPGKDPILRAKEVFEKLGMTKTKFRNGVLIYLAVLERKFAIIGDEGIDRVVPENFWDDTKEQMQALFRDGKFVDGVCLGIESVGEHLEKYFPYQDGDINELKDDISIGR